MDDLQGWALAAGEGDPVAVTHLVRATQHDVRRLCAFLVGPAEADDLAQETYERMLRALPGFRGDAPLRVWLLGIARRTCMDTLRRTTRSRRLLARLRALPVDIVSADHGTGEQDALLSVLDRDQRAAFVLTQLLGRSYAEAAVACEVPVGTIRSRVARARERLVLAHRASDTA